MKLLFLFLWFPVSCAPQCAHDACPTLEVKSVSLLQRGQDSARQEVYATSLPTPQDLHLANTSAPDHQSETQKGPNAPVVEKTNSTTAGPSSLENLLDELEDADDNESESTEVTSDADAVVPDPPGQSEVDEDVLKYLESMPQLDEDGEVSAEALEEYETDVVEEFEITSDSEDGEDVETNLTCSSDEECWEICGNDLGPDLCIAQRHHVKCLPRGDGAGVCVMDQFMPNHTMVRAHVSDVSKLDARLHANASLSLIQQGSRSTVTSCNGCTCFGENALKCGTTIITSFWRCGTSWFKMCRYHGRRRWFGRVSCSWGKTAKACAIGKKCTFGNSMGKCVSSVLGAAAGTAGEVVKCISSTGRCTSPSGCLSVLKNSPECLIKLATAPVSVAFENAKRSMPHQVQGAIANPHVKIFRVLKYTLPYLQRMAAYLAGAIWHSDAWRPSSMCTACGLWSLQPTDCKAFAHLANVLKQVWRAGHWIKETKNSLGRCAAVRGLAKLPSPFLELRTGSGICLPRFLEKFKGYVQRNLKATLEAIGNELLRDRNSLIQEVVQVQGSEAMKMSVQKRAWGLKLYVGFELDLGIFKLAIKPGIQVGWDRKERKTFLLNIGIVPPSGNLNTVKIKSWQAFRKMKNLKSVKSFGGSLRGLFGYAFMPNHYENWGESIDLSMGASTSHGCVGMSCDASIDAGSMVDSSCQPAQPKQWGKTISLGLAAVPVAKVDVSPSMSYEIPFHF